jgi:hypothetical protein
MSFADVYWVEVTFKGSQSTDQFKIISNPDMMHGKKEYCKHKR